MKWTIAIGFIGYGVLVLLTALGLAHHSDGYYWNRYWPVLLMTVGVEWLYRSRRRSVAEWLIPLLCLLFGGFFLLHNLGVIALTFIHPLDLLYAVGLIYVGMMILRGSHVRVQMRSGKHARKKDDWQFHYVSGAARDSQGESSAFADDDGDRDDDASGFARPVPPKGPKSWMRMPNIGEVRYGDAPWHLEPLVIDSLAGTIRINLATATVATGETPIVINGGAGEVRIQVPPELPVSIMVEVFGGEVRLLEQRVEGLSLHPVTYEDPDYESAQSKVRIYVKLRFGEVRITRMM